MFRAAMTDHDSTTAVHAPHILDAAGREMFHATGGQHQLNPGLIV
jgi:hypothetical protein